MTLAEIVTAHANKEVTETTLISAAAPYYQTTASPNAPFHNGVHVTTSCGKLLLLNVYMPCNYADEESLIEFSECLGDLNASIIESDAIHTIIAGDFNCEQGSRFFSSIGQVCGR